MASIINSTTTAGVTVTGDNSGSLQLATNNGTTAVTIDTSQNVGIGTSSPDGKLTIETVNSNTPRIRFQNASFDGDGAISTFVSSTGTDVVLGSNAYINSAGNFARFDSAQAGSYVYANRTGLLLFGTNTSSGVATERMRITSAGYVKASNNGTYAGSTGIYHEFNQNGNSDTLGLYSTASIGNQYGLFISTANNQDDTSRYFLYCAGGAAQKASFYTNGGLYNYSANNVNLSDRREKTNFAPAKSYLNIICSIPVQTFHYIDQNLEDNNDLTLGVVAQDVQIVAPELVTESNWASKGEPEKMRLSIYQTDLQYALMKSIQELKAELDATKAEVAALKGVA